MSPRAWLRSAFVLAIAAALCSPAHGEERESLPVLRRRLLEANTPQRVDDALDKLTAKIGAADYFADAGAFGDWLGSLPDGRNEHPRVLRRQGWAYVSARRGADALGPLQAALVDEPSDGHTRYYMGEALRQTGRFVDAAESLTAAARCGLREPALAQSFLAAITGLQKAEPAQGAKELPSYVRATMPFLLVWPQANLHLTLARWLLEDFRLYERPGSTRANQWLLAAAEHGLQGLATMDGRFEGDTLFALDLASAIDALDVDRGGRTPCFDLLATAYRLGHDVERDTHAQPRVLTRLAEVAAREGRYELAWRLIQDRLAISDSPRARRLQRLLPPDLGLDDQ